MAQIVKLIFLSLIVRFTITANRLIFFIKRIPLIGKKVPANAYSKSGLKELFIVLGILFVANKRIMIHLLYMVILAALGIVLSRTAALGGFFAFFGSDESFSGISFTGSFLYALTVWFIYSWAGAPTTSIIVSGSNHKNDNMMINYLRANPSQYVRSRILIDRIVDILLFFPVLLPLFLIARLPVLGVFAALFMFTSIRLLGEAFNMWLFKKTGRHLGCTPLAYFVVFPLYAVGVLIPYFLGPLNILAFFANPLAVTAVLAICGIIGFLALRYIQNYPLCMELIRDKIHRHEMLFEKQQAAVDNATFAVAKDWGKNVDTENLEVDKHRNKKGFAYLNAIFFDRHQKFFTKKILIRCLILLAPLAAALLFTVSSHISGGVSLYSMVVGDGFPGLPESLSDVFYLTPLFFFVFSLVSMGSIVTLSIFSNCDVRMLHYPYYRTAETILSSFKARFAVILRINFTISSVLFISIIGALTLIYGYVDWQSTAIFLAALTFIGAFFAFSDLFLYYVIQPYDSGGKDKSVLHKTINFAIGILSYLSINSFRIGLIPFTIIVAAAVGLYIGVGLILLYSLAPKRFKLR